MLIRTMIHFKRRRSAGSSGFLPLLFTGFSFRTVEARLRPAGSLGEPLPPRFYLLPISFSKTSHVKTMHFHAISLRIMRPIGLALHRPMPKMLIKLPMIAAMPARQQVNTAIDY